MMRPQSGEKPAGRIRLLIVSSDMRVGGVSTALLSLLGTLDTARFAVDLLLYDHGGPLQAFIPDGIRVLPEGNAGGGVRNLLIKALSPSYVVGRAKAFCRERLKGRALQGLQIRSRLGARYSRKLPDAYDLAISFIEFWPLYYVARYVQAKRKLAWIHVDYLESGLDIRLDVPAFSHYDRVVMVSAQCAENLRALCPVHAARVTYLPNLLSEAAVRLRAAEELPPLADAARIRLVTVSRIEFRHKGLDRGVRAFSALTGRGLLDGVVWYIIGGGPDAEALHGLIASLGLEGRICCLGGMANPLPVVRQCDAFFLPSHFEGKPMAVTEAMILGLPALVTWYASAPEQVEQGVDGLILANSREGIEQGLEALCETPGLLEGLQETTRARHYGNEQDIALYYRLFADIGVLGKAAEGWEGGETAAW